MMERVYTPDAPTPAGHYEQAWTHAGLVFVSGQLPIDPVKRERCTGTAAEQAAQALHNVEAILKAAGTGPDRVLKVTVYASDIAEWDEVDAACSRFFGSHRPARSVVPTHRRHYGFKVEIEATAAL